MDQLLIDANMMLGEYGVSIGSSERAAPTCEGSKSWTAIAQASATDRRR